MSLRNTNHLMSSMLSRASGISFDPAITNSQPQFNPATGSWVFGLAAFAAGVAVNKMIKPDEKGSPKKVNMPGSTSDSFRESHMRSLLRDTMAEESRSGEYVESISSEVARLRDEIDALSIQKNQFRSAPVFYGNQTTEKFEKDFNEAQLALQKIHDEKEKLATTEREIQQILANQTSQSAYTDFAENKLSEIQQKLHRLKSEQHRIQTEYEYSRENVSKARSEMDRLQQQLQEKISNLHEAEIREQALKRDYQVLMETVESLKTQLEFFRNKASQDQSGVTSLKILEESNSKLNDQVSSSLYQAEQQQAALQRLAAEKFDLTNQLEELKRQALLSEEKMSSLQSALFAANNAEKALLNEVERLSKQRTESNFNSIERDKLENELKAAQSNIESLERKEQELLFKLQKAEQATSSVDAQPLVNQLSQERDELKRALANSDRNNKDLEESYRDQLTNVSRSSGAAKTELVLAAEKEEELNYKISSLQGKVKSLENERDFLKSQSEFVNLKATNAGNEFMTLMKSIHTLESEKRSLSSELDRYKNDARNAENRLADVQRKLDSSMSDEKRYNEEITSIRSSISNHQQRSSDFEAQQKELQAAQEHIQSLIDSHQSKDRELQDARRELDSLDQQLAQLGIKSSKLAGSEQESASRVAMIQSELSQKDQLIANSRIQEDSLRREVEMLRQTSASMESEIKRLNEMQAKLGSSSTSLHLLQETEQQLKEQINQAKSQIENQHHLLLEAERAKTLLEISQREESLKLSAIQSENDSLKRRIQILQDHERDKQDLVSEIDRDQAYYKSLEREVELLKQRQNEVSSQLEQARNSETQLKNELVNTQVELQNVIQQRDSLQRELNVVNNELHTVFKEKNELQVTCRNLHATIQDLESQKNRESKFVARRVLPDKVIPLTQSDAVTADEYEEYGMLDTSFFDDSNLDNDEFSTPSSEKLFQSTKATASLRKFKGHRKIEDIETKESQLDAQIKENLELSQAKEMTVTDAESPANPERKKAYSPNRSFSDLLDENERRQVETKLQDPEKQWNDLDSQLDEDFLEEEKSSIKPLLYGGAAAGILIGSSLGFLYLNGRDSDPTPKKPEITINSPSSSSGVGAAIPSGQNPDVISKTDVTDLESTEMNNKVLGILQQFHQAKDFESKSKLCRLPNRTLKHMKLYAATNTQDHTVSKVELQPKLFVKNGLKFIVAAVEGKLDGETFTKDAYFVQNDNGELLLDWHNYVNYESAPWDKFLNFDDNKQSQDWHVVLKPESNEHGDYPENKFGCFKLHSWNPDSFGSAYAYLSKDDPMYDQLMEAYENDKQRKFILRLRHTGDGSLALLIDEVVSLSEFYLTDIDSTVSSSIDEISFGDSSY